MPLKPFGTETTFTVTMRDDQAWILAMCLHHLKYDTIRNMVQAWGGITDDEDRECERIREALHRVSQALAETGYAPQ